MSRNFFSIGALLLLLLLTRPLHAELSDPNEADKEAPTVIVAPLGGDIEQSNTITIQAYDQIGIHHIGYSWNEQQTTPVYAETAVVTIPKDLSGHNILHFYAKDKSPNYNSTYWQDITFNVINLSKGQAKETAEKEVPQLNVTPHSGKVTEGSTIMIQATDSSGINHIGYHWNSEPNTKPIYAETTLITVPNNLYGHNILHVYAIDNSLNYNSSDWQQFTFNVTKPGIISNIIKFAPIVTATSAITAIIAFIERKYPLFKRKKPE